MKRPLAKLITTIAKYSANSYIAGPELGDALGQCRVLAQHGFRLTICPWDVVGTPAKEVLASYNQALTGAKGEAFDCYVSVKLPSLDYDIGLTRELLATAAQQKIRVHFDALGPETVDRSLDVVSKLIADYPNIGWTLPSRWKRSLVDADKVIDLSIPVRLVKGQWNDSVLGELDPRVGFLQLVEKLALAGRCVAIATHDCQLGQKAIHLLQAAHCPCELEQLYGLPFFGVKEASKLGVPVRIYVPYGCGYLPYALSQLKSKPWMLWWLLRDAIPLRRVNYIENPSDT